MPHPPPLPEIEQIFLSATAQDCKDYREAVCDAVHNSVRNAKIFLQEHWAEGVQPVVDVCEARVKQQSDGYIGLFGYRYGWVPIGFTRSITELEFEWARERWTAQRVPPIFIMLPVKDSQADKLLAEAAEPFIEKDFPDQVARAAAKARQSDFVASVKAWAGAEGRMLTFYSDKLDLLLKAVSNIQNWNLAVVRQAPSGRRAAAGDIPPEDLGRIGRDAQIEALAGALDVLQAQRTRRAMAFLVHGPENHGQREFAHFLRCWDEWENTTVCLGQAPAEPGDPDAIARWACSQLQEPAHGPDPLATLVRVLAARLERSSVTFIQRSLGSRPDRLSTFALSLWQPLHDALAARQSPDAKGRLLWFVIEPEAHAAGPALWPGAADADDVDRRLLLPLPALAPISAKQVRDWLKGLKSSAGIALDADRRADIATRVTVGDGDPPDVYDRLGREGFWTIDP